MSYGVGHRYSSDLALLWQWSRPAAAETIQPLAWEPPYAAGETLKSNQSWRQAVCQEVVRLGVLQQHGDRSSGLAKGWRQAASPGRNNQLRAGVVLGRREFPLELTPQCNSSDLGSFFFFF